MAQSLLKYYKILLQIMQLTAQCAGNSCCMVTAAFVRRSLLTQVSDRKVQKRRFIVNCSKTELWVEFGFFFTPHFHHKTTHEARHFRLLCRFNFFKLVCIRSILNNSRMLLQSELMNIRFWKRKKAIHQCYLLP